MTSITLKGRTIPLLYTTYEMKLIQEEVGMMDRAVSLILGRNPDNENDSSWFGGPAQIGAVAKVVMILGNAGLEEAGENPDLTEKKILRSIKPTDLAEIVSACMTALTEGMASEIQKEETGPVDVTLEEMNKKKEPAS